jgi:hypothetical protein
MNVQANNHQEQSLHLFEAVKFNGHSTNYQLDPNTPPKNSYITEQVKIEKFQGFSAASGLDLYYRIKDRSSWAKSSQITGLFKTSTNGLYYGNVRSKQGRTLLLFKIAPNRSKMAIRTFPDGYFPEKSVINQLAAQFTMP